MTTVSQNPGDKIRAVTEIYNTLGIKLLCEHQIATFHADALVSLESVSFPYSRKKILIDYVSSIMKRQT
jgi:hypothetical protein